MPEARDQAGLIVVRASSYGSPSGCRGTISLDRPYHDPDDDLPGLLRAIASDDEDEDHRAFKQVTDFTMHQGTVYPTTAAAAPYLIELAGLARYHRADLIGFAGMVADHSGRQ